ncbi:MAG: hypothetical protein QM503_05060 [Bacteroidota bacterium]
MNFNYFNVSKSTTTDQLKAQKRELSKQHHPDKENGSEQVMKMINEEFDIASKLIKVRERRYMQLSVIEERTLEGLRFIKPQIEPRLKNASKQTLAHIVETVAPIRFKYSLLQGLEKLSPIIDKADIVLITQNIFSLAKHIVKPQSRKT